MSEPSETGNQTRPFPAEAIRLAGDDKPRLYLFDDLRDRYLAAADLAHAANVAGRPLGPVTGLKSLDKLLGYQLQRGVHILHGNTGSGKTAFCLQTAAACGFPALYLTCEMDPVELIRRIIARVTLTPLSDLKNGSIAPQVMAHLFQRAADACPSLAILDATRGPVPASAKDDKDLANIEAAANYVRNGGPCLVVIDSLHSWAPQVHGAAMTEYEALNQGIIDLVNLAAALDSPVLAIAEQNRASMGQVAKGGSDAALNAGAGTRKIEYQAETVLSLYRKFDQPTDEAEITLEVAKNRNGSIGKTGRAYTFNGSFMRFTEA